MDKSKIPKSVTIFGYRIRVVQKDIEEHGLSDLDARTIYLKESDSESEKQASLFHELIHMSLAISGLSFDLTEGKEEAIVRCLEHALWPLLKRTWK